MKSGCFIKHKSMQVYFAQNVLHLSVLSKRHTKVGLDWGSNSLTHLAMFTLTLTMLYPPPLNHCCILSLCVCCLQHLLLFNTFILRPKCTNSLFPLYWPIFLGGRKYIFKNSNICTKNEKVQILTLIHLYMTFRSKKNKLALPLNFVWSGWLVGW